jgi:hypothetical protein
MKDAGFLATAFIFLCIGIVCMFWPDKIQNYVLTHQGSGFTEKLNPFLTWMKTPGYVTTLRILGVMATGVALLVFWVFTHRA